MGKQGKHNFSSSQCWAIWTAYGMKCFWCKKTLEFMDCQIDQVIPKSVTKIVLASIIKDNNLGADFSTNSYGNWVSACKPCSKKRSGSPFRPGPSLPSWFESIRHKAAMVEAKVKRIDGEQLPDSLLRQLVQKLEQGELSQEDVERVVKPFLGTIEGTPKSTVEFRLSDSAVVFSSPEGIRLQSASEIRYQKMVEGIVEGGDWRKKKSVEQLREGPSFGEGRPRKPGSGPMA